MDHDVLNVFCKSSSGDKSRIQEKMSTIQEDATTREERDSGPLKNAPIAVVKHQQIKSTLLPEEDCA